MSSDNSEPEVADFVKFQTSIPKLHISKFAKKANYQIKNWKEKGNR